MPPRTGSDMRGIASNAPPAATRIAIVEDDPVISALMREAFDNAGFAASEVRSGLELRALMGAGGIDLVTLDLGLPGDDGIDLARDIRHRHDVPIIIVSAQGRPISKVVALEVGADDYVVKPFDFDELIARVRAVLRRVRRGELGGFAEPVPVAVGVLSFDGWRFDVAGHRVWAPSGATVELTAAECELLAIFAGSPRIVLSRIEIARQLRGDDDSASERSIDVIVGRLRRKLEAHAAGVELIKTLRGSGYLFCVAVRPECQ